MRIKKDKFDTVFSDLVRCRSNFTCESCSRPFPGFGPELQGLDCSHYIGRSHAGTRIHPANAFAHCKSCHRKIGGNPGAFYQHYVDKRGHETEFQLQVFHKKPWKKTKYEKEQIYRGYRLQLDNMKELRKNGHDGWLEFVLAKDELEAELYIKHGRHCGSQA